MVWMAAQNLDTRVVGIAGYDSTMGVLVLADSPIKTIKDMEGRKLGSTLQSAEVPFIDHYLTGVIYPESALGLVRVLVAICVITSWTGYLLLRRRRAAEELHRGCRA